MLYERSLQRLDDNRLVKQITEKMKVLGGEGECKQSTSWKITGWSGSATTGMEEESPQHRLKGMGGGSS